MLEKKEFRSFPALTKHTETEIKLRVASPEAARARLLALGARLARARHFEDNVLYDDASASLRRAGRLLRLRRAAGSAVVTYKGKAAEREDVKALEEHEVVVSDADAFERILAGIGLLPRFRYQKYRETYVWKDVEIVVDETPIGAFLEIEGTKEGIQAAAAALGRHPQEFITTSYGGLFFGAGGQGDMLFRDRG
jgi:adenylate cyclase class 2